jgi:hypothetical protein
MSDANNEWGTENPESVVLDELTDVQKVQIASYVKTAFDQYAVIDRNRIAKLENELRAAVNGINVLLECLENGIPVKGGKVTLTTEDMPALIGTPKRVH